MFIELFLLTVFPRIVSPFNSFRGNYSIYEVKNFHNVETRYLYCLKLIWLYIAKVKARKKTVTIFSYFLTLPSFKVNAIFHLSFHLLLMRHPPNECWRRIWMALSHCLGMSYYVNFFFHLKWRFGTHGSRQNQNPGRRFGATS